MCHTLIAQNRQIPVPHHNIESLKEKMQISYFFKNDEVLNSFKSFVFVIFIIAHLNNFNLKIDTKFESEEFSSLHIK